MEHHKIPQLLNDSTTSEFETRKWIELNDLLGVNISSTTI